MDNLEGWKDKIQSVLEQRKRDILSEQEKLSADMRRSEELNALFQPIACHLLEAVIAPRIKTFADQFDDAEFHSPRAGVAGIILNRERRYAASIKFDFAVTLGDEGDVLISFHPEIVPVFVQAPHSETKILPLNKIDDRIVADWVEEMIIEFAEAYIRVTRTHTYQPHNMVTDPVCGMKFNKEHAAAEANHSGIRVYFCTPECKDKFLQSPDQYAVHVK